MTKPSWHTPLHLEDVLQEPIVLQAGCELAESELDVGYVLCCVLITECPLFVAAAFVTGINSVSRLLSLRNLAVGLLLRCGLGDVAMVGDVSYRVNSKESPNPAKWSPSRPCVRRTERLFGSCIVCGDEGAATTLIIGSYVACCRKAPGRKPR